MLCTVLELKEAGMTP